MVSSDVLRRWDADGTDLLQQRPPPGPLPIQEGSGSLADPRSIDFPQSNIVFAENQPEYLPLPEYMGDDGNVITCWELTEDERKEVAKTGKVWFSVFTFNQTLQPQRPFVSSPFEEKGKSG